MAFQLEEDLSCPICQDIFKDPVVLSCSHSFCKDCLRSWFTATPRKHCPVCTRRSSRSDPPTNLALKNLCEAFLEQRKHSLSDEEMCKLHSEKFKLFCLDHQQPVCVVCRDSKTHTNHSFRPIEEAAQNLREELHKSLQPLKEKLQRANEVKQKYDKATTLIKKQANHTEKKMEKQYINLHQFLLEEEEAQMRALREEEELKTQRMKDKMAAVSREIEALSETIRATEEQLRAADVCFLLKHKTAEERVRDCPLLEETQMGPGALIDQAKHLGNLAFNIWTNMKRLVQYTPVILDPNKASDAVLSDDLTSFAFEKKQAHPNEPETTEKVAALALGSEGFDSGSQSWDIEVGDNDKWVLGVGTDPLEEGVKKEDVEVYLIVFQDGEYKALKTNEDIKIKMKTHPQKIRVQLDCDKHELSFKDADTNTLIHSITNISQKKLFPVFSTESKCPIKILPQEI